MSDQAVMNGENAKQVVGTATAVAGTVAVAGVLFILLMSVGVTFVAFQFLANATTQFVDIYKANYPEEYERLLALSKDAIREGKEMDVDDDDFDFEFPNELNFVSAFMILAKGDEENSRLALKEYLTQNITDDEEAATELTDALLKGIRDESEDGWGLG